jgi:hypothetical protein
MLSCGYFFVDVFLHSGRDAFPRSGRVVTKAQHDQVQEGMSCAEVMGSVGSAGEELSCNHFQGVPGIVPDISTKMYTWQNGDGTNMNAIFQNGRVVSKAQIGLR